MAGIRGGYADWVAGGRVNVVLLRTARGFFWDKFRYKTQDTNDCTVLIHVPFAFREAGSGPNPARHCQALLATCESPGHHN